MIVSGGGIAREDFLPLCVALTAALFLLIFVVFDLPMLTRPHSVAVVSSDGSEASAEQPTNDEDVSLLRDINGEVFVRYVAMGDERVSMLEHAPKRLQTGDRLMVCWTEEDPYDILIYNIARYIIDGAVFVLAVVLYLMLWYLDGERGK